MAAKDVVNNSAPQPATESVAWDTFGMTSGALKVDRDPFQTGIQDLSETERVSMGSRALQEYRSAGQRQFLESFGMYSEPPTVPESRMTKTLLEENLQFRVLVGQANLMIDEARAADPSRASLKRGADIDDRDLTLSVAAVRFLKDEFVKAEKGARGLALAA